MRLVAFSSNAQCPVPPLYDTDSVYERYMVFKHITRPEPRYQVCWCHGIKYCYTDKYFEKFKNSNMT